MSLREIWRKGTKAAKLLGRPGPRRALIRHRVAQTIEHDAVLSALAPDLVVDIGANRGQFSLAVRHFHPRARIVAFEPLPDQAAIYRRVFDGQDGITLHQAAISPVAQEVEMHVSRQADSSSFLPITALQTRLFPGTEEVSSLTVRAAPLSDFLQGVPAGENALLKIDVQGFELEVLKSALPVLAGFRHVYVEASFLPLYQDQALAHEVIDFLHGNGFALSGVYNLAADWRTGAAVQCDLLFNRR